MAGKHTYAKNCLQRCKTVNTILTLPHSAVSNIHKNGILLPQKFGSKRASSTCSMSNFTTSRCLALGPGRCRSLVVPLRQTTRLICLLGVHPATVFFETHNNYCSRPIPSRSRTHYYNVLNVTPHATQRQIKEAYYQLSKVHHPDINKHQEANLTFAAITEAYEVLGNVRKRHLYDRGVFNPQTFKSEMHEHDQGNFRNEEGFTSKRRTPPTGHTKIYNFDEFYRQHYQTSRQRKLDEKLIFEQWQAMIKDRERQQATNIVIMGMVLIMFMIVAISSIDSNSGSVQKNNQKKN